MRGAGGACRVGDEVVILAVGSVVLAMNGWLAGAKAGAPVPFDVCWD